MRDLEKVTAHFPPVIKAERGKKKRSVHSPGRGKYTVIIDKFIQFPL